MQLSYIVIMIVLDASTLILITKIDLLDPFLASVRREVAVPTEVARECCAVKKTLDALTIQKVLDESRITVSVVKNRKLVAKLSSDFGLGLGEAEAIALAVKERVELVGIDDKSGINACKLLGIPFTTALGILIRSCEKGLIHGSDGLAKLVTLAAYGRYQSSIIEHARLKLEAQR
jgi:predicted nucleic acid-binding protein